MSKTKFYYCPVSTEGPSKTKRAKVPTGVFNDMGAVKGQLLELEVDPKGKVVVSGRIVKGHEAKRIKKEGLYSQSRPAKKTKPNVRTKSQTKAKAKVRTKTKANGKVTKRKATPAKSKAKPKRKVAVKNATSPVKRKKVVVIRRV